MSLHFKKVVIVGVGLIGASLGMAGKKKGLFSEVVGVGRSESNLKSAVEIGAIDRYTHDVVKACQDAELIVLATPVERILSIGKEIARTLSPGACLTDVGSVKKKLVDELEGIMPDGVSFVGGHPIAGSEESGALAGRIDLFEGARTILTPSVSTDPEAVKRVQSLWESVGSVVMVMNAAEHDAILAAVSHLPHMVAYALVNTVADAEQKGSEMTSFAAGGFKDTTRIASSHPEMWAEICKMNKEQILHMIDRFEQSLRSIKEQMAQDNFETLAQTFDKARNARNRLL